VLNGLVPGLQRAHTQLADQVDEQGVVEAGTDVPGVPQVRVAVNAEQQGADRVLPTTWPES
jgi:hypothetical protein